MCINQSESNALMLIHIFTFSRFTLIYVQKMNLNFQKLVVALTIAALQISPAPWVAVELVTPTSY